MCKLCSPACDDESSVQLHNVDRLEKATLKISRFLLEFFFDDSGDQSVMRPLTNSNFVCDFYRYQTAEYYHIVTHYLKSRGQEMPSEYHLQYQKVLQYFWQTKMLHKYDKLQVEGAMPAVLNTKSLQPLYTCEDGRSRLGQAHYYKFRPANLMFGFNSRMLIQLRSFSEFNSLRKNQLLAFYGKIMPIITNSSPSATNKYRDYYFMPQFEIGQQELIDLHHYTYDVDLCSMIYKSNAKDRPLSDRVHKVNDILVNEIIFSTQNRWDYEKFMPLKEFKGSKEFTSIFRNCFMSVDWFQQFVGLGFPDINPKDKEFNCLTQTSFYSNKLMVHCQGPSHDFEKQCVNEMSRNTLRKQMRSVEGKQTLGQEYNVSIRIGQGFCYSKYNSLMHFLNVVQCYWLNPDLNSIQVFGKDIRTLLVVSCQKIFFEPGHNYYHYGPIAIESNASSYYSFSNGSNNCDMDLHVSSSGKELPPSVSNSKATKTEVIITDRVYEYSYLKGILEDMFSRAGGARFKTDDFVLNLSLLSLMLDFGLCERFSGLLNLPFIQSFKAPKMDTRQLQVEVSNLINDFEKKNTSDSVTRLKVEELIFEVSYKFLVNKDFNVHSNEFALIRELMADPAYNPYVLLVKIYVSLCQINKSTEVDYYKMKINNQDFRIIIPQKFSRSTSDYLEHISKRYTFSDTGDGFIAYDGLALYDVSESQPDIDLYDIRFDSSSAVSSMVTSVQFKNTFKALRSDRQYLIFIADNVLMVHLDPGPGGPGWSGSKLSIKINKIPIEIATIFFNEAISFVPCFRYVDGEDVILFTSRSIHWKVDRGGQFCSDYYGMKFELIDCIYSEQVYVDLNDEHVFKFFKLSDLLTESKLVLFSPHYLLQVQRQQQLINLLDMAIHVRNVSFFILVLFYLRRASVHLAFEEKDKNVQKIAGPWIEAIRYVLKRGGENAHYEEIFEKQFFDLNQHQKMPLRAFIDVLCENFQRYQRHYGGQCEIVPSKKQREFLYKIITAEECFHFSEVGSGKTKVILPLLCQVFLSNNAEAHRHLAQGSGEKKHTLIIIVPEHLVLDAQAQVYRYCLNLNFREEYRVYDNIFALLNDRVQLCATQKRDRYGGQVVSKPAMKQIFVTSFNTFKKALTNDKICAKVRPNRKNILVLVDEVDDFLDRDKLVFNICSSKNNALQKPVLARYLEVCRAVYRQQPFPGEEVLTKPENLEYWEQLHEKLCCIHNEIHEKSKSINKNFGIFNEHTLRHCNTNIQPDIEGYKCLIARPYESVNRAMPGSYYSDIERTIFLSYFVLMEDTSKYNELFQQERKFINFEYFNTHISSGTAQIDYDDLVYGSISLSELVEKHPQTKDGLTRFLFEIILRRLEIRDKSRSVNSIDIVFNFDCIGFTGTPFIDNYPTFGYIQSGRQDSIPDLIDRSFYVYESESVSQEKFEERFMRFQGKNSHVMVKYMSSFFIEEMSELEILARLFEIETMNAHESNGFGEEKMEVDGETGSEDMNGFNCLVDLCGIFKKTSVYEVKALLLKSFGMDRFRYIYHIDQTDGSDRVLYLDSDTDVQFDEEFYKYLCNTYGERLRDKIFFFVDNRNVIGKDIPFQLIHQKRFRQPMFYKSVVLAHDVDDFSKIWQAMGRSRTMNQTVFAIYKSGVMGAIEANQPIRDIKSLPLTRRFYVANCDRKMAGNLSSIYQTLISLFNLSQDKFYYCDEIVNVFLEKMEATIGSKVRKHMENVRRQIFGSPVSRLILEHILGDKFTKSANARVREASGEPLTAGTVQSMVGHIIQQKYEQRQGSGDIFDEYISFLSGEQEGRVLEISYTKEQQKQKQKQQNKNKDSDTMEVFDESKQVLIEDEMDNYFQYTLNHRRDLIKHALSLPIGVPICKVAYNLGGKTRCVNVYPTLQFLYSKHIKADYITPEVKEVVLRGCESFKPGFEDFFDLVGKVEFADQQKNSISWAANGDGCEEQRLHVKVLANNIRQTPLYSIAAIREGVYVIGMKDQFNIHDMQSNPIAPKIEYVADEMGFVLYDKSTAKSVDAFGPYFIEQYIVMEVLSKHEVAQNVMEYYVSHKEKLQSALDQYNEEQGKGFICWRFINDPIRSIGKHQRRNEAKFPGKMVRMSPHMD